MNNLLRDTQPPRGSLAPGEMFSPHGADLGAWSGASTLCLERDHCPHRHYHLMIITIIAADITADRKLKNYVMRLSSPSYPLCHVSNQPPCKSHLLNGTFLKSPSQDGISSSSYSYSALCSREPNIVSFSLRRVIPASYSH